MYYKVLLKDGREFKAFRGFWENFWSGWIWTVYKVADNSFGLECNGKNLTVRHCQLLGAICLGKKLL